MDRLTGTAPIIHTVKQPHVCTSNKSINSFNDPKNKRGKKEPIRGEEGSRAVSEANLTGEHTEQLLIFFFVLVPEKLHHKNSFLHAEHFPYACMCRCYNAKHRMPD